MLQRFCCFVLRLCRGSLSFVHVILFFQCWCSGETSVTKLLRIGIILPLRFQIITIISLSACVAQWLERRVQWSDDPCVGGSNPTVGRGCRSFGWDRINRGCSRCGTIKIHPCSKALSAEHRPKFCSPSPVMVTSPYNPISEKFLSGT